MQPLEFEIRAGGSEFQNRRDAVRIVSGELGQDDVGMTEQASPARQVGNIRRGLARVPRITLESARLTALDLAVPIRALDQTNREPAPMQTRGSRHPVDHV